MTTPQTATLTDFILARIAEDEARARAGLLTDGQRDYLWDAFDKAKVGGAVERLVTGSHDPAHVLAVCAAHRRIVEEHPDYGGYGESCATCAESSIDLTPWPCPTLRALASAYADHEDWREEWR